MKDMKWTPQQIQALRKKVYGNYADDHLFSKVAEMNTHLENYEKSFLRSGTKHEWTEVERLADEISALIHLPPLAHAAPPLPSTRRDK